MNDQKLKFQINVDGDKRMIAFTGAIDEDFVFDSILENKGTHYLIDFNELKMINSCGIREWIRFVEQLGPSIQIEYYNCPQIIIQQMNMVSGFLSSNATVKTFYAPYYCEDNDEEKHVLLKSEDIKNNQAPQVFTEVDGEKAEMEFDAIEEQYFKFLKR